VWQLLKFDASLGARALFGRQDIAASFVGDVLVVHNCFSLTADVIYLNYTLNVVQFNPLESNYFDFGENYLQSCLKVQLC